MIVLMAAFTLTWTAPGDDGHVGRAAAYDLRYASDSATVAAWNSAIQATGEPSPRPAGSAESFQVSLPPGKYWFAIRARDEAGNQAALSNLVSRSQADTTTSAAITSDNFETGFGSFTDGGTDCIRYYGTTHSHQGAASACLMDNTASSTLTTSVGRNVTGYASMEVDFWFKLVSMEPGEDFWLQYSSNGGTSWQTVATYVRAAGQYSNNAYYHIVVSLPRSAFEYTTNAKLRFCCDASGNQDFVYLDEIIWRGKTGLLAIQGEDALAMSPGTDALLPDSFRLEQNSPNPFNPTTTLAFVLGQECQVRLEVYNLLGRQVATLAAGRYPAGRHVVQWDARGAASGVYFYRMQAGSHAESRSMTLLK